MRESSLVPGTRSYDADVERPTELVAEAPPTIDSPEVQAPPVTAGMALGRYVAIEESGRGGMGSVVRAYDPKLQREVALKRLHTSRMTEDARTRLVREARAMAQLGHPNVVAVFDVESTEDFGLMVVMEYVSGLTLRSWLREQERPWTEIVDAFVEAGRGLAAAHAVGLLHRDFKPANVLVNKEATGERRVRVTDFGLARPRSHDDSNDPSTENAESSGTATEANALVGTPMYMAPEQLERKPLTVAADQYAFCLSLWEALVGQPPFTGSTSELRRARAEGPPPWPREADAPRPVVAAIRRGLDPNPEQRWPSMDALLRELRAASSARDRRRRVAIAGSAAVLGIAGVWVFWPSTESPCSHAAEQLAGAWDADRRTSAEAGILGTGLAYAASTATRIGDALDEYAREWIEMHTDACEATSVRHEQSEAVLDARMSCLHRAKVELDVAASVLEYADAKVVENADKIIAGLAPLTRCADVEALMSAVPPPLPDRAEAVDGVRSRLAQVRALLAAGKPGEAETLVVEVMSEVEGIDYPPLHTEAALERGRTASAEAKYEEAEAAWLSVLRDAPPLHQWEEAFDAAGILALHFGERLGKPEVGLAYLEIARGLGELTSDQDDARLRTRTVFGALLIQQGKLREAGSEFAEVLDARLATLDEHAPKVAQARAELARALRDAGRFPEAEAQYRLALAAKVAELGEDHPSVAGVRNSLAVVLTNQGKYAESEKELLRVLEIRERVLVKDHPDNANTRTNLAQVYFDQGRYAEAERELKYALRIRIATFGENHPDVAGVRNNLTGPLVRQGKNAEAEATLRAALAGWEAALGPDHPDVALARSNLAALLSQMGNDVEAVALLRSALPVWERALGPGHPDTALGHANLGRSLHYLEQDVEAERELRGALEDQVAVFGADHAEVAATREVLAQSLAGLGRLDEAITQARTAVASFEGAVGGDHPDTARARRTLGGLLLQRGAFDEATTLLEAAWKVCGRDDALMEDRAPCAFALARALWRQPSQRKRARDLAHIAGALWGTDPNHADDVHDVEEWLESH